MKRLVIAAAVTAALGAPAAPGQMTELGEAARPAPRTRALLNAGDAAPALDVAEWVKGERVDRFAPGKVYVITFLATWSGPSSSSLARLTALQKQYGARGVTVVGVTSPAWKDTLERVREHLARRGDAVGFAVAFDRAIPGAEPIPADDQEPILPSFTNTAYMRAAKRSRVPTSFVIDGRGRVAFIGHPLELEFVIDEVVAGTWDPAEGPERLARMARDRQAALDAFDGDPQEAVAAIERFEREHPKAASQVAFIKVFALLRARRYADAYAAARPVVDGLVADGGDGAALQLNELAWEIVDPQGNVAEKDLSLALRAAEAASAITKEGNGPILDTVARVHWLKGDRERAVALQRRAVAALESTVAAAKAEVLRSIQSAPGAADPARAQDRDARVAAILSIVEQRYEEERTKLAGTLDEYLGKPASGDGEAPAERPGAGER